MSLFALDEGLRVSPDGVPRRPARILALDALHEVPREQILRAASRISASPVVTIGIAHRRPPPALAPLLDAATVTLAADDVAATRQIATVADVETAAEGLLEAIASNPRSAIALNRLLRQTSLLPTPAALAAEAAVYSMLLGGSEFHTWLASTDRPGPAPAAEEPPVLVRRTDDVLELVLNRPDRRNAMNVPMREELYGALEVALADEGVGTVRILAAGPDFCAGGDLSEFGTAKDLVAAYLVRIDRAPWALVDRLADRIQVHVQGASVGAGVELAAFAGTVTCSANASFRLPELAMGLVPGAGGTVGVVRRIGTWRTAWMVLSGATIDARVALDWGLVDAVAEPV